MSGGKDGTGVFASALARITGASGPVTSSSARPGALKQVRGATYPPPSASSKPSASTPVASAVAEASADAAVDVPAAVASPVAAVAAALSSTAAADSVDVEAPGSAPTASAAAAAPADTPAHSVALGPAGYLERARDPAVFNPATSPGSVVTHIWGCMRTSGKVWPDESSHVLPTRMPRFQRCLEARTVDLDALRQLAWSGVPAPFRISSWSCLLGYLPTSRERQMTSIAKKRTDYQQYVAMYFGGARTAGRSDADQALLRQVLVDVPRTLPEIPLCRCDFVQRSLERVLYVWAMRHPASGYVQGINDIATPFYAVFLSPWADTDTKDLSHVDPAILLDVEADVFWCLTKLLDGIQDHFTPAQPGIQRMIYRLRELAHRIDEALVTHLESNGVEFFQFAFRWMNCLLMRELPFRLVIRLWDTYLAEEEGFDKFHTYVCAALLLKFSAQLKGMKFQELVTFMQKLPTKDWGVKDVEELLSQAYVYKTLFESAPSHLS